MKTSLSIYPILLSFALASCGSYEPCDFADVLEDIPEPWTIIQEYDSETGVTIINDGELCEPHVVCDDRLEGYAKGKYLDFQTLENYDVGP